MLDDRITNSQQVINERLPHDLSEAIRSLKKQKNAVILAHSYQSPEIQDIADFVGDSLALSRQAAETSADIIIFAGVRFMAETAKVLSPEKKVILPALKASCSLVEDCQTEDFARFVNAHPNHIVITYINSSLEVKAMSDYVCTSSNALAVIKSIPEHRSIIFAPDKNLGRYLMEVTGRDMLLWDAVCEVHESFSISKINELHNKYPEALIIAHPECPKGILTLADFIGSTSSLLRFTSASSTSTFIVVTEAGILHEMKQKNPEKNFIAAPPLFENKCACSECEYMKLTTLEKVYRGLRFETPEISVHPELGRKALIPIQRMLDIPINATV